MRIPVTNQWIRIGTGDWITPTSISTGTETTTVRDVLDRIVSVTVKDFTSTANVVISGYTNTWLNTDGLNRDYDTVGMDGRTTSYRFSCCGLESMTDKDAAVTYYDYDTLNQRVAALRTEGTTGIKQTNILDVLGRVLVQQRIGTNGNTITQEQQSYDILGRVVYTTNALGGITTNVYSIVSGRRREVILYPDGGTRTNDFYRDGQIEKVSGTAIASARYDNNAELESSVARKYSKEIKLNDSWSDSSEWSKTYIDMQARQYRTIFPDGAALVQQYNSSGQKTTDIDADDVRTIYRYDTRGALIAGAVDVDHDGHVANYDSGYTTGSDRVTKLITYYLANGASGNSRGTDIRVDEQSVWTTASSSATALVKKIETATSGLKSWWTTYKDQSTPVTSTKEVVYGSNGSKTLTETAPTNVKRVTAYSYGRATSITEKDSADAQVVKTDFNDDEHGRRWKSTDARNGTTIFTYNAADQTTTTTTPTPGIGMSAQTTTTTYDSLMRATVIQQPDGKTVTNEYNAMGTLKKTYGARTYPVEYTYDSQGRMRTMKTWQDFAGNANTATTTWNYHSTRGWLDNKRYNDSTGPDYTYTLGGRLGTRTWARTGTGGARIYTTYSYGATSGSWHGDLVGITYSNDPQSTPAVTYSYDRRGRRPTVSSSADAITYSYTDAGQITQESHGTGTLNGYNVTLGYNSSLQFTSLSANTPTSISQSFSYKNSALLDVATQGSYSATYSYASNSKLISQILFKEITTTRLTTTRSWDCLNRLLETKSAPSASGELASVCRYGYNDANQRISCTLGDGSYWEYQYDQLGQVVSGKRFWGDGTPVSGQQFEFGFDDIGNRKSTKVGGDGAGQNLQSATYNPNLLNQYSQRTVPAVASVLGIANPAATVTVNSQSISSLNRKGEYFWKELSVANSSASVWQSLSIQAVNGANSTTVTGNEYVPKTPELYSYDSDGNLTQDGRWNYTWDGENRLVRMVAATGNGPQQRIDFTYDPVGRRVRKQVWNNTAGTGTAAVDIKFLYDGWNLVAELDGLNSNANIRIYLWGTDASGSRQGAGGVGGLLAITDSSAETSFVAFDGNGNVIRVVDASGVTRASYEYGPFGEAIRSSGSSTLWNPIRFSTKYRDSETELLYYGFRSYSPGIGRFLQPDPSGEIAFALISGYPEGDERNRFAFVLNDPTEKLDYLGLDYIPPQPPIRPGKWRTYKLKVVFTCGKKKPCLGGYTYSFHVCRIRYPNWQIGPWYVIPYDICMADATQMWLTGCAKSDWAKTGRACDTAVFCAEKYYDEPRDK